MMQPPDVSNDHGHGGASKDDKDSQHSAAADPLIEHAEAGWRLGCDYLDQADAGAEPDLGRLNTAIGHLEVAVLDGIDGAVLRDPELLQLLGLLLLLGAGEAEEAAEAVEEAHAAFAEGLDCPGLEEPLRLSLLNGALLACRNRVALLESGADIYHPAPDLAAARDALVAAAEALFLAVPPEHEGASSVATALIHALATRLIGRTGPEHDTSDLLRLVRARPDMREAEGVAEASTLVMIVNQALMVAFEHDGREELLLAVADLVAEAQSWPDLPPRSVPFLTLTMASVIVNSPDDGALATRLGEVRHLLDGAVSQLPPDDPHLPQIDIQRVMLLQRLAARSQDPAVIEEATREISRAMPQLPPHESGGESAMLAGLLGGVLDTRFRRRHDLRDMRTGLKLTERAIAGFSGSAMQRAVLLANRGLQLLRIAWTGGDPDAVGRALEALRTAIASTPAGSSLDYQLHGVLAAGLTARAQAESGPQQQATLREAWAAASKAAEEEPPKPQTLMVQVALAVALGDADPQVRPAGEHAARRLREVRSRLAERQLPTELIDLGSSLLGGIEATRPGASPQALDAALSQIDALSREVSYPDMAGQLLGMQKARMLRHRDNLEWQRSLQAYLDQPAAQDVQRQQLLDWLQRGGSDVSEIRHRMAQGLVERVRDSPGRCQSRDIGVQVLRRHALRVLLQSGTQDAIMTARAASGDSHEVVTWCLADGADDEAIAALETGRGLTLLAAGATGSVSDRLEAIGEPELAQAWRHSQDAAEPETAGSLTVPEDVRHRVLDRLAASGDLADVLEPPDRDGLAATLRQLGYDALVYLVPQGRSPAAHLGAGRPLRRDGGPGRPGGALMITAGGQVHWQDLPDLAVGPDSVIGGYMRAHHALLAPGGTPDDRDAWRDTLEQTCQWAWTAAMGPLRPTLAHIHSARRARVVLVPVDALCVVPWHAAYPPGDQSLPPSERRYALDAVTFSYAASGALLSRIARRSPPVLDSSVLLVGDPGGDLPYAQAETQALRTAFYPGATTWGEPPELTDGAATPARLRAALADAGLSLFHYAGHATVDAAQPGSSALVLGDQRLRAERISRLTPQESYCVCLAACTTHLAADAFDEVFTLSTAFLLGGASTVLGSLWRMKDAGTAVLMFLVHHYLSRGARPVDALHRAQMWMLNPDRRIPESMPAPMRDILPGLNLTDPVVWAGLTHQGH
jgi:CHAT domain